MSTNDISSVKARLEVLKDLKDIVKERFLGLLGIRQPKVLLEDEQEVYLQVGRTVWHAPRQLRIELWLSSLTRRHTLVSEYQTYLAQDITREASVDIEKDVQRTFPNTRRFKAEEGQEKLRNVLRAYAAYDPEVAYCQGMNFLTGLLLMYMPSEGHAFAALVILMEDRKLRNFYHRSMALLQVQLWQLSRLISPSLNQHLEGLGVVPMLYGASWLMTAFSADFPIPFSARIMDVLLADQCECALLKVATTIMKSAEKRLKAMTDLEDVLGHLKIEVPAMDEADLHALLTAAFTKPWTSRQLAVLRSTEGAETVAQAMDRVMNMNEQLTAQVSCEEEEMTEDGEHPEPRASTIPKLHPPPTRPAPHSFANSPACSTPITGGGLVMGTGSCGGAGSPPASAPSSARCHAMQQGNTCGGPSTSTSCGGAVGGPSGSSGGAVVGFTSAGVPGASSTPPSQSGASSLATWFIPSIHPIVSASPAIQAFRRKHEDSFQAAVAIDSGHVGRNIPFKHGRHRHITGAGFSEGGCVVKEDEEVDLEGEVIHNDRVAFEKSCSPGNDRNPSLSEEWGEFNVAAVRQQWDDIMRSAQASTRHVQLHPIAASCGTADGDMTPRERPWCGVASGSTPPQDAQSGTISSTRASQPIPVPGTSAFAALATNRSGTGTVSGSSGIISAFANPSPATTAAGSGASIGKPPLPPRCSSFDRGPQFLAPGSRLSVVTEDPLAVQMGPAAPEPSPRGSMDLHLALSRSSSQPLEAHEQCLLYGTTIPHGSGIGSGSCNGELASGTMFTTTAGVVTPSGLSGGMSPLLASPRQPSWAACSSGVGTTPGDAHGGATPNAEYMQLCMDRTASGSLHDGVNASGGGGILSFVDRSTGATSPLAPTHQVDKPPRPPPQQPLSDMATDIAGDILRMLSAVDTCNAHAAYDTRAILGESMYADSPNKEKTELVRRSSENHLRHLPSSSMLAEMAAQDLAKAQVEAERVRQELEAQLQQQRAAERGSFIAPETARSFETGQQPHADDTASSNPTVEPPTAPVETAAAASARADAVEAAVAQETTSDTTSAPAAGGAAATSGSDRAGVEEVVLRRPLRIVDGITIFDPKSLMTDSSEPQAMFTPAVSPGASSYTDPQLSGFTPTAEPATPVDPDAPDASERGALTSEASLREDITDEAAHARMMVTLTEEAEAEGYTAAAAEADADDCLEYSGVSGAGLQEPLGPDLEPQATAAEWVDWSQAPPLQNLSAMVVPPIKEMIGVSIVEASTMKAQIMAPSGAPDRAGTEAPRAGNMVSHADDVNKLQEAPTPSGEIGSPAATALQRDTLLGDNLIDMASPVRPLAPRASARVDRALGDNVSFCPVTSYGTGLSPVAVKPTSGLRQANPYLHQQDSCQEDALVDVHSSQSMVYGLLPLESTMPAVLDGIDNGGASGFPTSASAVGSQPASESTAGGTAHAHTGNNPQRHSTFEVYPTCIASAAGGVEHLEIGRGRENCSTARESGFGSEVLLDMAASSTAGVLWLDAHKVEGEQPVMGKDLAAVLDDIMPPPHIEQIARNAHLRQQQLPTPSDTEDAVSDERSDRGTEAGLSGVQTPPEQDASCMGGIGDGEASDIGEVENSPFRIALSPSLANHIMSVYSRSEVHQREQEKREAEERLQRQLEERQRQEAEELLRREQEYQQLQPRAGVGQLQESEQLVIRSASVSGRESTISTVSALSGTSMVANALQPLLTVALISSSASDVVALAAESAISSVAPSDGVGLGEPMHSGYMAQAAVEDTGLATKLVPPPVASAPRLGSGLVTPVLGSPGRNSYGTSSLSFGPCSHSVNSAATAAAAAIYLQARPQTPFAMTLDDPSAARMSAEVLAALSPPPQLALLHSDRSVLHSAAGSILVSTTTVGLDAQLGAIGSARGSLRCTGSGEGDPTSAGSSSTLHGFGSGLSKSAGGALHLDLVSHGALETSTGGCPPTPGATRAAMSSSSGGAVPPLLPPPPPPQVPLSSSVLASTVAATNSGPVPPPPVIIPPVPCGGPATAGTGVGATTAASTPVIATALPMPPIPAIGPTWTATFDGVDDAPTQEPLVGKGCNAEVDECGAQPRHLSSAFAAEGRETYSPTLPVPDSCSASSTTTGINTPEARLHTPDMARGMSIEAVQLPTAPAPQL